MSVKIIDTLKPKNNGSFPIVEAVDVSVSAGLRLPEALASKADASDLAATNAAVSAKADKTTTDGLQNQINQIEISASSEAVVAPEVAGARVGEDGTSYSTLKERLDAEQDAVVGSIEDIYTDLQDVGYKKVSFADANDYYISSDGTKSGTSDTYNSVDVDLAKGEKVVLTAKGYSSSISMIALKYEDDTYKNVVASRSSDVEQYIYTAQSDCTVTLSFDTRASHAADIIYSAKTNIDRIEEHVDDALGEVGYKSVSFAEINGFFINTLGYAEQSDDFNSVFVDMAKGETVKLTAKGYSTSISMIAVQTQSERYSTKVYSDGSTLHEYTYTADEDCTAVLSFDTRAQYSAIIVYSSKGNIDKVEEELASVEESKTEKSDFDSYVKYNGDSSRPSVNMYDYKTASANTRLTSSGAGIGNPKSAIGYHLTDFIPASVGDELFGSFSGIGTNVNGYCTYNANHQCIAYNTYFGKTDAGGTTISDEGTAFIRVEMKDTLGDYTKYQIQQNGVTPLEPYGEKIYYKGKTIVTIKTDGTGDYTSIREAFETEGAGKTYHIYPGEYEVSEDFTAQEIASASYSSAGTGFVGIRVPNDSEVIGIGSKYDIIIKLTLDPDTYSYTVRSNIATLNLFGNCHIENITVIAENARTPIHDDFQAAANCTHVIKNCELKNTVVERPTSHGYGLGMRSGATVEISDCNIYPTMIIHSNTNFTSKSVVMLNNTNVYSTLSIGDDASVATTEVYLNNTSFGSLIFNSSYDKMHLCVNTSCKNPIFADKIEGSCIVKAPAKYDITAGKLVRLDTDSHDIVHAFPMSSNSMQRVGIAMNDAEVGEETSIFLLCKYVPLEMCEIDSASANAGDKIAYTDGAFSISESGDFGEVVKYGPRLVIALY